MSEWVERKLGLLFSLARRVRAEALLLRGLDLLAWLSIRLMALAAFASASLRESLDEVASDLARQGRLNNALPIYQVLHAVRLRRFGPHAIDTARSAAALSSLMSLAGDTQAARALQQRSLLALTSHLGPHHVETLKALGVAAFLAYADGDLPAAAEGARAAVDAARAAFGADDARTLHIEESVIGILLGTGEVRLARALSERIYRRLRGDARVPDEAARAAGGMLGAALYLIGDHAEARQVLEDVCQAAPVDGFGSALGNYHAHTFLALLLVDAGEPERARTVFHAALHDTLARSGTPIVATLEFVTSAVLVLGQIGDFDPALDLAGEYLSKSSATLPGAHPLHRRLQFACAMIHLRQGKPRAALGMLEAIETALNGRWPAEEPLSTAALCIMIAGQQGQGDEAGATRCARRLAGLLLERQAWYAEQFQALFGLLGLWASGAGDTGADARDRRYEYPARLGRRLAEELEVCDLAELDELQTPDSTWREDYLRLCAQGGLAAGMPLAPLYGSEAWLALMPEEGEPADGGDASRLQTWLKARRALTELRAQLSRMRTLRPATPGDWPLDPSTAVGSRMLRALADDLLSHPSRRPDPAWMVHERALIDAVRHARAALDEDLPAFRALSAARHASVAELCAPLAEHEGLLLLFRARAGLSVLIARPHSPGCELREFGDQLLQAPDPRFINDAASGMRTLMASGGLRASRLHLPANPAPAGEPRTAGSASAASAEFWSRVQDAQPAVRQWHVITGPGLHTLRLEAGRPAALAAGYYCGLPAFLRLRSAATPCRTPPTRLAVYAAAANGEDLPIPFVLVEQDLIRRLAKASAAADSCGPVQVDVLPATELALGHVDHPHLALACHGLLVDEDATGAGRVSGTHAVLALDPARGLLLRPADVLALRGPIAEVFLSTCVGGQVGNTRWGDPLGLVSALQLRGTGAVVAALDTVPDFWMPLLAGLYWHGRLDGSPPSQAFAAARRRLRMRDWPPGFVPAARAAYANGMVRQLEQAIRPAGDPVAADCALRMAAQVDGWLLPEVVRSRHFDVPKGRFGSEAHARFSLEHCCAEAARQDLADQVCTALFSHTGPWPVWVQQTLDRLDQSVTLFGRDAPPAAATTPQPGPGWT